MTRYTLLRVCCIAFFVLTAFHDSSGAEVSEQSRSTGDGTPHLRIKSVEPTVLFIEKENTLLQVVEVVVENDSSPAEATMDVALDSSIKTTLLGAVQKGVASFQIHVPDADKPTSAEFVLKAGGKEQDRRKMPWQPQRHWEVCMVPITHHDLGYTDTIPNVLKKYDGFYDNILQFCDETDDWPEESKYRYTVEVAWSIQHFIENRPKEFVDKLAKYIKEGRIELGALFGNEIDALCSHEELIRLLYPSFSMKREYGETIHTASITDIPGLSWGMPTVLAGSGVKYFFAGLPTYFEWGNMTVHPFWDESAVLRNGPPDAFRWEGPDGGSVLVYYSGGYGYMIKGCGSPKSCEEVMEQLPGDLAKMQKQGSPFSVVRYIHNGGDNFPPDVQISRVARQWNDRWAYPKLIVATNTMFFERLEKQCKDVRTFKGELPHTDYTVGATSTAKETALNRLTHNKLSSAEKFATIADILSESSTSPSQRSSRVAKHAPYLNLEKKIGAAYNNMLLYDEHTWGMNHALIDLKNWDFSDKVRFATEAAGTAESVLEGGIASIAGKIRLGDKGKHVVVFNPLSVERTDVVRLSGKAFADDNGFPISDERLALIDAETGKAVPYQVVKLEGSRRSAPHESEQNDRGRINGGKILELVFVAEDVPSLGWKTYRLTPAEKPARFSGSVVVGDNSLENRFYKITLDPRTGTVESIYDKELSREMVDEAAPHKFNQLIVRWSKSGKEDTPYNAVIHKGQSGPICSSLVTSTKAAAFPQVTQEIILYENIKRIDLANRILKESSPELEVYFAFPFKIDNPDFRFEGSCSVIKPFRDQFPGSNSNYYAVQHWADASDGQIGVTLSPIESHLLEFGGLRPCYVSQAHHKVTPPDFGRPFATADEINKGYMYSFVLNSNYRTNFAPTQQGDMLFRYSITTRKGDWKEGGVRDFGWASGNPLIPFVADGPNAGTLERQTSFCSIDRANVTVLTVKQAEDGKGLIIRLIETEGKQVTAKLSLPRLAVKKAYLTNLMEENESEATFATHEVAARVEAFGITTIRIQTD